MGYEPEAHGVLLLLTVDEVTDKEPQPCAASLWQSDRELTEAPHQGDSWPWAFNGLLCTLYYAFAVSGK